MGKMLYCIFNEEFWRLILWVRCFIVFLMKSFGD